MFLEKSEALLILNDDHEEYETILDKICETSRWSIHYELVVKNLKEDKFYIAYYSTGATETQDESPWEDESEVEFLPAIAKERTIKTYEVA